MAARTRTFDESFPHTWEAEILPGRPLIGPARRYVYPLEIEEVELGALELLLRARPGEAQVGMTFALGFADPALPHGLWSCPDPAQLCAVAGGYAYVVHADDPTQWMQIPYRPVTSVHPVVESDLLVFAGFHCLWALGSTGQAWETQRVSWEGVRVTGVGGGQLHGFGWDVATDTEIPFTVNLRDGGHTGGSGPASSENNTTQVSD